MNEYIRAAAQDDFTGRDFRTWVGSLQAFEALEQFPTPDSEDDRKRTLVQILDAVRHVRSFVTRFYTGTGNFDMVGDRVPVFLIQAGFKSSDLESPTPG